MNKWFSSFTFQTRSTSEYNSHVEEVQYPQVSENLVASVGPRLYSIRGPEGQEMRQPSVDDPSVAYSERIGNINSRHRSGAEGHEKENAELVKELHQMAEMIHGTGVRCRELGASVQRDSNESRGRVQELERSLQSMEFQFHATIEKLEFVNRRYEELEESTRRHGEQMQVVKEELRRAEAHHAQTRYLLEERTTELTGAQRFLTQTDSLSGAEAIAMAESLNAEILQAAAYMADSLEFSYRQTPLNTAAPEPTRRRVLHLLGDPMMHVLESKREQDATDLDPTPVQIALQITMVYCSAKLTELWVQDDRGGGNETLGNIFSRIAEKEEQVVSGRWRSMTRAHAGAWNSPNFAMNYVVGLLVDVLSIAGWAQQEQKADALLAMFRERLSRMVDLILRLRKGIGEDITSAHINAKRFRSGVMFDSRTMDDTYADDRRNTGQVRGVFSPTSASPGEKVAGTTEIGLQRVVKGHQPFMLLKPKVVLCSAL